MCKTSRLVLFVFLSILLISLAGCRVSLAPPTQIPATPTAIPPTPTPTPDPWVQAVADAQEVVAKADIVDHFRVYQETAAQIDQYLVQLEKTRPALDLIDKLKNTNLPIIGNVWDALIAALDKGYPGSGQALNLMDEGVRELLAYHHRLQRLNDLDAYGLAIQRFQQSPSRETLLNMGQAMTSADEILATADQDAASIQDKVDSVNGAISMVRAGLAAAGGINPQLQNGIDNIQGFVDGVAAPVEEISRTILTIRTQIATDRDAFSRVQEIIYLAEHPPTVVPSPPPPPTVPAEKPPGRFVQAEWLSPPAMIFGGLVVVLMIMLALLFVLRSRGAGMSTTSQAPPPSASQNTAGFITDKTIPYRPLHRPAPETLPPTEAPTPMQLRVIDGKAAGRVYLLTDKDILVGRSSSCDIQLPDPAVSRRHFRLRYAQGAWFLQDQNSTGGTFVNGQKVTARRLQPNDEIRVGEHTLRFESV